MERENGLCIYLYVFNYASHKSLQNPYSVPGTVQGMQTLAGSKTELLVLLVLAVLSKDECYRLNVHALPPTTPQPLC